MAARHGLLRCLVLASIVALGARLCLADEEEKPKNDSSAAPAAVQAAPGAMPNGAMMVPPGGQGPGNQPGKPGEPPGGKPGEQPGKPGDAKAPDGPKPVQRPAKPETPPNPDELKVRPNEAGKIRLNFNGQPWPDLLKWLADVSNMSLDWQELPGDYLNLTTQQQYTVREVRDLINRASVGPRFYHASPGRAAHRRQHQEARSQPGAAAGAQGACRPRSVRVRQGLLRAGLALGREGRHGTQADAPAATASSRR